MNNWQKGSEESEWRHKIMLFRKFTLTFFQQKNITKMFKEGVGWVGGNICYRNDCRA